MSHRTTLRDLSFDNHGILTLDEARDAGVPAVEVHKLAARGALTRLGSKVYRMNEAPSGPYTEFAAAVAMAGEDAVLADDSVLAALGLAQVNLRTIRVAAPKRFRRALPSTVEIVVRSVPQSDRDTVEGIPAMSVRSALLGSRTRIMPSRLIDATHQAVARGLIDFVEAESVVRELESE